MKLLLPLVLDQAKEGRDSYVLYAKQVEILFKKAIFAFRGLISPPRYQLLTVGLHNGLIHFLREHFNLYELVFSRYKVLKFSKVMAYTNSNPVARKSFTFPSVLFLLFPLNKKLFLATGFEFALDKWKNTVYQNMIVSKMFRNNLNPL